MYHSVLIASEGRDNVHKVVYQKVVVVKEIRTSVLTILTRPSIYDNINDMII